jgi:DNA-binding transcriptional ArsR family regulator
MADDPPIAAIAALIGDPARANMLTALMDGQALTVSELAGLAGVALPTASGHLARMNEAGLVAPAQQGRHRYYRLASPGVAEMLEALMQFAATGRPRVRPGPREPMLREARVCYDHLAGRRAVALADSLAARALVTGDQVTPAGEGFLTGLGIDVAAMRAARRPLCRTCLDWSERRNHLAGALGAGILAHVLAQGWAVRAEGRVVRFSQRGAAAFEAAFGLV